jgi:preprotein translocase subunit SecD
VSEPSIQKLGGTRIIVELPGVTKESEVRQLLQGTALLEFKLLKDPEVSYRVLESIDKALAAVGGVVDSSDTTFRDTTKIATPEGEKTPEEIAKEHPLFSLAGVDQRTGDAFVPEEYREKVRRLLEREDVQALIPRDMHYSWSAKTFLGQDGRRYYTLYPLKSTAELTGGVIVNARATIDPNTSLPIVTMEMNSEGSRDWARITGANVDKRIAIVLDNAIFSAPVVRNKIIGGNSQIEGMDNTDEARLLEIVLKAGALPAPVQIIEQRSVGPSLGEDSIESGVESFILAVIVTMAFIVLYYRTGGIVATGGMIINTLFIFATLAAFTGTLTLPGVAGIVLAIGMSVDANVLIFERIREEQATGKTLRAAIDGGYTKAFSAIFDSNVTTLLSGIVLYQFGTGPVQGFALTLMMGVAANLFTAITITRVILEVLTERGKGTISFG